MGSVVDFVTDPIGSIFGDDDDDDNYSAQYAQLEQQREAIEQQREETEQQKNQTRQNSADVSSTQRDDEAGEIGGVLTDVEGISQDKKRLGKISMLGG